MTTAEQNILETISGAAKAAQVSVIEFNIYTSIQVVRINIKHPLNKSEISLTCSIQLVAHNYLYNIFNELNNVKP